MFEHANLYLKAIPNPLKYNFFAHQLVRFGSTLIFFALEMRSNLQMRQFIFIIKYFVTLPKKSHYEYFAAAWVIGSP